MNEEYPVITSTFQCTLQILFTKQAVPSVIIVYFYYKTQSISRIEQIEIKENIMLPLSISYHLISISQIKAQNGLQVNVTVLHMFSSFFHNSDCTEWGFLTIEYLHGKYEESNTLCSSHNSTKTQSRSFYSINSSLFLIYYTYPGAGETKVSLVISTTKCKPVHFDPCIYFLLRRGCKAVLKFKPYLPNIVKFLNVSLIPGLTTFGREEIDLLIKLKYTQCIVVQIGNRVPVYLNLPKFLIELCS